MSTLDDRAHREQITHDTGDTLFVNAGAGSGKTSALVDRVTTLVISDGVPLAAIAAVTFTDKAGAELRDRLRERFEALWRDGGSASVHAAPALDDLDDAAIGTLHSFAQRILTEYPIEARLPPLIEVLDEVGSSVAFDERWNGLQTDLLDDESIAPALLLAMSSGMKTGHLRSLALALGRDWDLLDERILDVEPPRLVLPAFDTCLSRAHQLLDDRALCTDPSDKLLAKFDQLAPLMQRFDQAADDQTRIVVLRDIAAIKFTHGQKGNWLRPIADLRSEGAQLCAHAKSLVDDVLDQCLRTLVHWLAAQIKNVAESRRREGALEFHDLLVLTRDLLRRDANVRASVHRTYQRVLLDEFQDTDPIQIEIAARICAGEDAGDDDWRDIDLPPGRLFVVGDAKQSIYRFRRANIATYLQAQSHIGRSLTLTTNFRSVAPVVDWVNAVFEQLITEQNNGQPRYEPLRSHRTDTGVGPAVTVLGATEHDGKPGAAELREWEAADVASVIGQVLTESWTIFDERVSSWRPARLGDIAILVPARTSLPFLEESLDSAGIAYRAEASSLVYHAEEIRDLLAAARAIADSSDALSLVTALRSSLFGCGDDDLWRWRHAGGRFSIHATVAGPLADGPVGAALTYLRTLSFQARWMTPSELLGRLAEDRRMFEVAATRPRARDSWRRLRFVIDQARAWSDVSHGGLRAYLAWAAHQGQEIGRVAESVLPETDVDAVRIMTIHAAKGLEFPIVILSGMTSQPRTPTGVRLLWPATGGYQVKLTSTVQTGDFDAAQPVDEQMDDLERRRLLYVAATRARDHLVVSLHRGGRSTRTAAKLIADVGGAHAAHAARFDGSAAGPDDAPVATVAPPPPHGAWLAGITAARANAQLEPAISASGLEGTEPEIALHSEPPPGRAKGPRDLELPPWSKGRYGSAIGRAVHAVLQSVDLATGAGLTEAVTAQAIAEGITGHEDQIEALARSALSSDIVARAATAQHWRETYLGATGEDGTIIEGYADLIYREPDGSLVVVDYKTDAIPAGALDSRVEFYAPQMAAYRHALSAATGAAVSSTLLFLSPTTSVAVPA